MNSKNREEWDLNHPDDQMPTKLGIDGQYIPERYIPFNSSTLQTFDVITNEDNEHLMYYKEDKSYKIYDIDRYRFLANPFKKWGKLEYPKTSDQSLSTTGDVKRIPSPTYEMNMYFTPSIEDIHVGYEYEMLSDTCYNCGTPDERHELRWNEEIAHMVHPSFLQPLLKDRTIRVPYLTKEQIEKEGWEISITHWVTFTKGNYAGIILPDRRVEILLQDVLLDERTEQSSNGRLYLGQCKDINTFRKLMKLLGI